MVPHGTPFVAVTVRMIGAEEDNNGKSFPSRNPALVSEEDLQVAVEACHVLRGCKGIASSKGATGEDNRTQWEGENGTCKDPRTGLEGT